MIEIGGLRVKESWAEYGVEVEPDLLVECETLAEAEQYARVFKTDVLERHGYLTDWRKREAQS